MKVIWFTRIRYDRGRHFSGDSGAAVWVDEIRSASVLSCHVSECASPHIFAVLSVICFGHRLLRFNCHSIVILFGLKCLDGFFSMQVCVDRSRSLYVLSVIKVCLKSLNCLVRVEYDRGQFWVVS